MLLGQSAWVTDNWGWDMGWGPFGSKIRSRVSLSSTSRSAMSPVIADRRISGESVAFRDNFPSINKLGPLRVAI